MENDLKYGSSKAYELVQDPLHGLLYCKWQQSAPSP